MAPDEARRQQLIHDAMVLSPDDVQDVAAQLWQGLALQLIVLIGENGFNSLYTRSLYLAKESFPWLPQGDTSRSFDFQFTDLKLSLASQSTTEADTASRALLQIFTNSLASLIGEPLILTILISAWADNSSGRETADKEFRHE